MGGAAAARRRLRHQLVALLPAPVASAAAPLGTPPMAEVAPEHEIEAAAMQYHRSGYTILRDAVPAELLRDLQRRFDGHAEAHVQSLGPELPRGRLTFYELNEDAGFVQLAELLTNHPVLARCAELSWLRAPEVDHRPYGSVLLGGEPSDGSWHVDAQGPLSLYADTDGVAPEPRDPGLYDAPQPPSPFPERNGIVSTNSIIFTFDPFYAPRVHPDERRSHGTRHMPPSWVHSGSTACDKPDCPGCYHCATAPAQPRVLPGMVRFTGKAGDALLNNASIWHTSGPNTTTETRKLCWILWGPKGGVKSG